MEMKNDNETNENLSTFIYKTIRLGIKKEVTIEEWQENKIMMNDEAN
jgi:hypothetical protein